MRGKTMLYVDQYGTHLFAASVRQLREQVGMGKSRVAKMYQDKRDGRTVHVGYVVGRQWFKAYAPVELPA